MPDREHTDPQALDQFFNLPAGTPPASPWYRRLWRWIKDDLFAPFEPVEPLAQLGRHAPIPRRIRVHKRAVKLAKYLRWYEQEEAREIYAVAGMLLGFDKAAKRTMRTREGSRP